MRPAIVVPAVVASVVEPAFTVSLSYWMVEVVSELSIRIQNDSVAVQPAGIVTDRR